MHVDMPLEILSNEHGLLERASKLQKMAMNENGSNIALKASQAAGGTRIRDEAPVYTLC